LKKLSKPGGILFFAFPPWYMPFGGHQQIVKSKVLSKLPWIHLLPRFLYKSILKSFGEPDSTIKELMELDDTGISIERFDKIASKYFSIEDRTMFFINPIYQYKFKLKVRKVIAGLKDLPFFRNFYTTAVYFTLKNDK
ncbi:MAG: class I SAM-dependent methyltransferase, partial [Saprospiraceae bacterium]